MNATDISIALDNVRLCGPLVYNITNHVTMNFIADALLAIGASPIMSLATEEVEDLLRVSGSLVINIGTVSSVDIALMNQAAIAANANNVKWVFDPVGVGATAFRTQLGRHFLSLNPTVIRGNASEVMALFVENKSGKGVDSVHNAEEMLSLLCKKAEEHNVILAVTGKKDYIISGQQAICIDNGHAMMASITGTGCVSTGLIGGFLAVTESAFVAAIAALSCFSVAGECAASDSSSIGNASLKMNILDQLYRLSHNVLEHRLHISTPTCVHCSHYSIGD